MTSPKHHDDETPLQGVYETLLGPKELTGEEIQAAVDRAEWTSNREKEILRDLCALPDFSSRAVIGRYMKVKGNGVIKAMEMLAGILEEVNEDD